MKTQTFSEPAAQLRSFTYTPWRHGGWYVPTVQYPSGAVGCVSRNYPDGRWRIVCDSRDPAPTYRTRDDAAAAELALVEALKGARPAK